MSFLKTVLAVISLATALQVSAAPIVGLYNTGDGSTAGNVDDNYKLDKTSGVGSDNDFDAYEGTGIPGSWLANTSVSQWLTPNSQAGASFDANTIGIYEYSLTFDLSGMNISTAEFAGRWATDNAGEIFLNGTKLNNDSSGFGSWSSFSSAGGTFESGLNTLTFIVTNFAQLSGNPTGLRVEFLSSNVEVPTPSTIAILAIGIIGLSLSKRRKSV
jgi:hypothetical protein